MPKASKIRNDLFRLDTVLCLIFLIAFLLPFFYISLFNFSGAADDLFFATYNTHLGYFEKIVDSYQNYIGRYFNAFFFSISPEIFMKVWFAKAHPIVDLVLLILSTRYLIRVVGLSGKMQEYKLASVFIVLLLLFLPQINTVYWFSGATVYMFPISGLIFIFSFLVKDHLAVLTRFDQTILALLILAVGGSNEIFMVFVLYGTLVHSIIQFVNKKTQAFWSLLYFAVAAFSNYLVITSPGTTRRINGESFRYAENHLENVLGTILPATLSLFWEWFFLKGLIVIPLLFAFGTRFFRPVERSLAKLRNTVFFLILFLLSLIVGGIFIYFYAFGTQTPILPRVLNIYFILGLLLLICLGVYLNLLVSFSIPDPIRALILYGGLATLAISQSQNWEDLCSDLREGKAKQMQEESIWRFNYIAGNAESNVVVPRLTQMPKTFMVPEWGEDITNWTNRHLAQYFNKESISINHSISVAEFRGKSNPMDEIYKHEGFVFFLDKGLKKLVIKNEGGDSEINFFMHFTPIDSSFLAIEGATTDFINKDFVWPKIASEIEIELPNYKLRKIHLGQYSENERYWTETIYINDSFYQND